MSPIPKFLPPLTELSTRFLVEISAEEGFFRSRFKELFKNPSIFPEKSGKEFAVKIVVFLCSLFFSAASMAAGQFSFDETPGAPDAGSGGGATHLEIISHGNGRATFVTTNPNVNFLGKVPAGLQVAMSAADKSGKGTAQIVNATGKYFEGAKWCWSGVGKNWKSMACAPIQGGKTSVEVDFGEAPKQNVTVAMVPHIETTSDGLLDRMNGWATHADNAYGFVTCPATGTKDMITPITIEATGKVRVATDAEVNAYQPSYAKVCKR